MKQLVYLITFSVFLLVGCVKKKSVPADIQKFAGVWEVKIHELPKVGDKKMTTYLTPKDSVLTGYFTEDNGGRTDFSEIEVSGNEMICKYNWGGHNVSYIVEMNEATTDTFEGRMMGFFKVKGIKKK